MMRRIDSDGVEPARERGGGGINIQESALLA
jgi:hypothetical protein